MRRRRAVRRSERRDGSSKDALREVIEVASPRHRIVRLIIDVPDVRDVVLFQVPVYALADADQAILVATRQPEELQLLLRLGRIRDEHRRRLRVRRGGEGAKPGEAVEMCEAE